MLKRFLLVLVVSGAVGCAAIALGAGGKWRVKAPSTTLARVSVLDQTVKDLEGKEYALSQHRGQVVLIVNTASKCGMTKQYAGLQALHEKYAEKGLVVLAFPSNDFGRQEPGTAEQIREFCSTQYNVSFPLMEKVAVKGADQSPVYRFLTREDTAGEFAGDIEWNFAKFLIDRHGNLMARFHPRVTPEDPDLIRAIEAALAIAAPATTQPAGQ